MSSVQFAIIQTALALTVGFIAWFTPEITAWFKKKFKRKPKYRVGQKVRVIRGLNNDVIYNQLHVYRAMMAYRGSVVTISTTRYLEKDWHYEIEEDYHEDRWNADMFEPLNITKQNAFEALLHGHISDEEYKKIMKVKK